MDMFVTFVPTESGIEDSKSMAFFTCSSGTARKWAEERSHMGATYHVINVGSALPID